MPLTLPVLDDRRYDALLADALARVAVHTPEYTNFNRSDPGVTIIEVFAFLAEMLLYRANQIPERNRKKFLQLLGIPLLPASAAKGIVTFSYSGTPPETVLLSKDLEVRAGRVPFRTRQTLDVLPLEAKVYYKARKTDTPAEIQEYYDQLYASFEKAAPPLTGASKFELYTVKELAARSATPVDLDADTVDKQLWIALLAPTEADKELARSAIGGKTLNLGFVPYIEDAQLKLPAGSTQSAGASLVFELPAIPASGGLPAQAELRVPEYRRLQAATDDRPLESPGVVQVTLPEPGSLTLWNNLDPLEDGTGDFPPSLENTNLSPRLLTWIRIRTSTAAQWKVLWAGINACWVDQRARVSGEVLPDGTGEPDQSAKLINTPVIPDSLRLTVQAPEGQPETWTLTDDLYAAGAEVPVRDPRSPAGYVITSTAESKVFTLDPEAGTIRFGDGEHGARPPAGARIRATYDYSAGASGNVAAGAINSGPALPQTLKVNNPAATWNGAAGETVADGEKQIAAFLQHRERLVTEADFANIAKRTPGADLARVDVLPAFHPDLSPAGPGDAPGAVTLMVIPRLDAAQPDAPRPNRALLEAICKHLDARRLLTTEIYLRGPVYVPLWVTVGFLQVPGASVAEVREAIDREIRDFLSPFAAGEYAGWPREKSIVAAEIQAVASRVEGVRQIRGVKLAQGANAPAAEIAIKGIELPRILGLSVSEGDPLEIAQLRDTATGSGPESQPSRNISVPFLPEECS
jgi:hypothetical protein